MRSVINFLQRWQIPIIIASIVLVVGSNVANLRQRTRLDAGCTPRPLVDIGHGSDCTPRQPRQHRRRPSCGRLAHPRFTLTKADLSDITAADLAGQRVVLNIFPSIDTPTCAESVRQFNELASGLDNTTVLNVSADLPFAQGRFCAAEDLDQRLQRFDVPRRLRLVRRHD